MYTKEDICRYLGKASISKWEIWKRASDSMRKIGHSIVSQITAVLIPSTSLSLDYGMYIFRSHNQWEVPNILANNEWLIAIYRNVKPHFLLKIAVVLILLPSAFHVMSSRLRAFPSWQCKHRPRLLCGPCSSNPHLVWVSLQIFWIREKMHRSASLQPRRFPDIEI